jgi:Xaa-Pro aminopeptidase
MSIQAFGEKFNLKKFYHARDLAKLMASNLASKIQPGMVESDAHEIYKAICKENGVEKNWHAPKLRFGPNTLKTFKEPSDPHTLQEEDIFYIDIGPIVDEHEADYGETFQIGNHLEQKRIIESSKVVFTEVREHWRASGKTGKALYDWAYARAEALGYHLNMGSDGHRISDFPHHVFFKGAIIDCNEALIPDAWILEIQLDHPSLKFGAFYEDILR